MRRLWQWYRNLDFMDSMMFVLAAVLSFIGILAFVVLIALIVRDRGGQPCAAYGDTAWQTVPARCIQYYQETHDDTDR